MTIPEDIVVRLALEKGWVDPGRLAALRRDSAGTPQPTRPHELLVQARLLSTTQVAQLQAEALGYAWTDLRLAAPPASALAAVPREVAIRLRVCPVDFRDGRLQLAVGDPFDLHLADALAHAVSGPVEILVAAPDQIEPAIQRVYGPSSASGTAGSSSVRVAASDSLATVVTIGPEPVVQWAEQLIETAVRQRASDIHIEPLEKRVRVRYRVDGTLLEVQSLAKEQQLASISRLKLMANLSIAEKRRPQDGRIQSRANGRSIDLRVASLPTVHGESIVMRILDQERLRPGLGELGLWPDHQRQLEGLLKLTDGLVVVTGPTGSGKTTTLYSCLHHLNQPDRKIITVEDPVEYQLTGINQVPVRPDVGMTFAAALRAILRQSPNVVMVGEIRDPETAEVAVNAALTGHLVLSTLHTNDAPGAITRLLDLGLKPFVVAAALRGVIAQRLVRRVCRRCGRGGSAIASPGAERSKERSGHDAVSDVVSAGCPECWGTGFLGRVGLYEFFVVEESLQPLIHQRAAMAAIRTAARTIGWRTLREDGLRKAEAGVTTLAEVLAQTVDDSG